MNIRHAQTALLLAAAAALARPALAVATAPYFPFHTGDARAAVNSNGLAKETVTGQREVAGSLAWRVELKAAGSDETQVLFWHQTAAGTSLVATEYSGQLVLFDPPVTLPADVTVGQVINASGSLTASGLPIGIYQATITVLSTSASAQTRAADFTDCLDLRYDITATVLGQSQTTTTRERRARGVGTVWLQADAEAGSEPYLLLYARVGQQYWGYPGDINGDRRVNYLDALMFLDRFLSPDYDPLADLAPFDGAVPQIMPAFDGTIDDPDLAVFLQLFSSWR